MIEDLLKFKRSFSTVMFGEIRLATNIGRIKIAGSQEWFLST
jgi:hypothetical protein